MKKLSKITLVSLALTMIISSCSSREVEFLPDANLTNPNQIGLEEISTFASETTTKILSEQDKDKDSKISKQEAVLTDSEMIKIDTDRDGQVSKDEVYESIKTEFKDAVKVSEQLNAQPTETTNFLNSNLYNGDIPSKPPTVSTPKVNKVSLYLDREEILPMMFESIRSAKKSIQMDLYLLGGKIGLQVAKELADKAAQGVDIKLVFDPNLGFSGPTQKEIYTVIDYLQTKKINFKLYPLHLMPKVNDGALKNKFQIDHNKLTVIDENIFITGGFNLFDIGVINRDMMMKIEGPTAKEAADMMTYEWLLADKYIAPKPPKNVFVVKSDTGADSTVKILRTAPFESTTKKALIEMIDSATKSVYLAVLEFSDMEITNALIRASKRGVDVKVMMDRKDTNDKYAGGIPVPEYFPNIRPAVELVKNQVPVRWYDAKMAGQELHMKICVVDERNLIAGSTNFTTQAFTTFRETSVQVEGGTAPVKMARGFLDDWLNNSTAMKKITLKDKIKSKVIEFMDKRYYGWW